jgi:transposase-like protein
MKAMVRHRIHSVEFKHQVALEYLAGDTLKGLSRRHDISRNLFRLWVKKFEAGEFDEDSSPSIWCSSTRPASPLWNAWPASRRLRSSF